MADYHPLISKAVQGLENNTGEARRGLYERARTALIDQLRGIDPPLSEADITRERVALEEAIRKVESEAARKSRPEPRRDTPTGRPTENRSPFRPAPGASGSGLSTADRLRGGDPRRGPSAPPPPRDRASPRDDERRDEPATPRSESADAQRARAQGERSNLASNGLRGFRDVVSEVDNLGKATAQAGRSARRSFSEVPDPGAMADREREASSRLSRAVPDDQMSLEPQEPDSDEVGRKVAPPPRPRPARRATARSVGLGLPVGLVIRLGLIAAVILLIVAAGVWGGPMVLNAFRSSPQPATQKAADTNGSNSARPKIPDRVTTADQTDRAAAVAQRVVLYEEDPSNPQGKQYVGVAVWRNETTSASAGKPAEVTIRADIEVPEKKLALVWVLRRNLDQTLPASHTIEVTFNLPGDFDGGGVDKVPGVLMKQSEQTRGVPLAGIAVKVTPTFFLIGLSAVDADRERNVQMLKERQWFDVPIVYANQKRAILAVEKGLPGERAFADAFAAWTK